MPTNLMYIKISKILSLRYKMFFVDLYAYLMHIKSCKTQTYKGTLYKK